MRQRALPRNQGPRVSITIDRRLDGMRESGHEIAHLPPDAAAVLEPAGTKHQYLDRARSRPITDTAIGSKDSCSAQQT